MSVETIDLPKSVVENCLCQILSESLVIRMRDIKSSVACLGGTNLKNSEQFEILNLIRSRYSFKIDGSARACLERCIIDLKNKLMKIR